MRASTGLVIGKFYPPHQGHRYLIETAQAEVERLTVILCQRPGEKPAGAQRANWLRIMHPGVEVKVVDDIYDPSDSRLWAELTLRWLGEAPDVVFTSEAYGDRWARYLGSRHRSVDPQRLRFTVSGSLVRSDPLRYWGFLEPCVRAYYAKRVTVVGAESTGTTTMAKALAERYETVFVPEYGRTYYEEKVTRPDRDVWEEQEFVHIASRQSQLQDEAAPHANRILVSDTDALATAIWHERYRGYRSASVDRIASERLADLYLLSDVDIPFVQDGFRDGEHIRGWMHRRFLEELERRKLDYVVLSGAHPVRLAAASAAIEHRWPALRHDRVA